MVSRDVVTRSAVSPAATVRALPRQGTGDGRGVPSAAVVQGAELQEATLVDGHDDGRGTPMQALAGWGGALVAGGACWAGVLWVVGRLL